MSDAHPMINWLREADVCWKHGSFSRSRTCVIGHGSGTQAPWTGRTDSFVFGVSTYHELGEAMTPSLTAMYGHVTL